MNYLNFIIVASVVIILFYEFRINCEFEIVNNYFNFERTNYLRGGLAIIILGYVSRVALPNELFLESFHTFGFLAVAVLFFLSGYGLPKQTNHKENCIIFSLISVFLFTYIVEYDNLIFEKVMAHNIGISQFSMLFIMFFSSIYIGNKITSYPRNILIELYLLHFIIINVIINDVNIIYHSSIYVIIVIFYTLVLSICVNKVDIYLVESSKRLFIENRTVSVIRQSCQRFKNFLVNDVLMNQSLKICLKYEKKGCRICFLN